MKLLPHEKKRLHPPWARTSPDVDVLMRLDRSRRVYKTAYSMDDSMRVIVTLILPAGAIVKAPYGWFKRDPRAVEFGKCRASRAQVVGIRELSGRGKRRPKSFKKARSRYNSRFIYRLGATVKPRFRFGVSLLECTSGIHFFHTRSEAEAYC